jgi:hypothetical protein
MAGLIVTNQSFNNATEISVYREDGSVQRVSQYESVYITEETPIPDQCTVDVVFDITKSNSDEGLVSGWANVAVNADGSIPLDWQDYIIKPETLEKAAIGFMMDYRGSGVMHQGDSKGVVVESIVFTKEKQACIGIPEGVIPEGWFITVKVLDPEVFAKVKDGTFKMFSIQGSAKRIKL